MKKQKCEECINNVTKYGRYCQKCRDLLKRMYSGESFEKARERIILKKKSII